MIIYFSGTGNSRYAARFLSNELQDEIFDAGKDIKSGITGAFQSDAPWIFVSPTYAWRLPHIFSNYLRTAQFSKGPRTPRLPPHRCSDLWILPLRRPA